MGAAKELPPFTTEESVDATTDESVVENVPAMAVASAAGFEDADADAPATTELSSVGDRAGAAAPGVADAFGPGDDSAVCGSSGVAAGAVVPAGERCSVTCCWRDLTSSVSD